MANKERLKGVRFLVVVGEYDSSEFQRQTTAYAKVKYCSPIL